MLRAAFCLDGIAAHVFKATVFNNSVMTSYHINTASSRCAIQEYAVPYFKRIETRQLEQVIISCCINVAKYTAIKQYIMRWSGIGSSVIHIETICRLLFKDDPIDM